MCHYTKPHSVRTYVMGIVAELEPFYPSVCGCHRSPLLACTLKGSLRRFSSPLCQNAPLTQDDLLATFRFHFAMMISSVALRSFSFVIPSKSDSLLEGETKW